MDLKKQNQKKADMKHADVNVTHLHYKITFPSFLHGSWPFLAGTRFSSPTICKQHTEGRALANEGGAWLRRLTVGLVWSAHCCRRRRGRTETQLQQKTAQLEKLNMPQIVCMENKIQKQTFRCDVMLIIKHHVIIQATVVIFVVFQFLNSTWWGRWASRSGESGCSATCCRGGARCGSPLTAWCRACRWRPCTA